MVEVFFKSFNNTSDIIFIKHGHATDENGNEPTPILSIPRNLVPLFLDTFNELNIKTEKENQMVARLDEKEKHLEFAKNQLNFINDLLKTLVER